MAAAVHGIVKIITNLKDVQNQISPVIKKINHAHASKPFEAKNENSFLLKLCHGQALYTAYGRR